MPDSLKYATLYARVKRYGYSPEEAAQIPLHGRKRKDTRKGYVPRASRPCKECGGWLRAGYNGHVCEYCRNRTCEWCKRVFLRRGAHRPNRFCTLRCQAEYQKTLTGDRAGNWRGGVDTANRDKRIKERARKDCKHWRYLVFERDRYTCQVCGFVGQRGKTNRLHAHHVKSFKNFPELRTILSNGITLCGPCHSAEHRRPITQAFLDRATKEDLDRLFQTNIKSKYQCHKL